MHPLLKRERLNQLLKAALKCPIVVVIAGAGYGKTQAVTDFLSSRSEDKTLVQMSEQDNHQTRFWEHYAHALSHYSQRLGERLASIGFPVSSTMRQYSEIIADELSPEKNYILVLDDFHNITAPDVLAFFESIIANPQGSVSIVLVSRIEPTLNLLPLIMKGKVAFITEDDLRFTKQEVVNFFKGLGVVPDADSLATIYADTEGWAFSVNLIGTSLTKAHNTQYARSAMRSSVFKLLDVDVFSAASPRLQHFLVQMSLIDFLAVDLVHILAGDDALVAEMAAASSFIRYDTYLDAYRIHRLLLDFLTQRQDILSAKEKQTIWQAAAAWCMANSQRIDAVAYFEKAGAYAKIADYINHEFPQQIPPASAEFLLQVFENAPPAAFDGVLINYVLHMRILLSLSRIEDAVKLANKVLVEFEKPPLNQAKCRVLCSAYVALGIASWMRAPLTDVYDFDYYFERDAYYYKMFPFEFTGASSNQTICVYASMVGTQRAGAFADYLVALKRTVPHTISCLNGNMAGIDALAAGELLFYQADFKSAEIEVKTALTQATLHNQYDIRNRALYYLLRIYLAQGKYESTAWVMSKLADQLDIKAYHERQLTYDIITSRYFAQVGSMDLVAAWLNEEIEETSVGEYTMDFANLIKAWLLYTTGRYEELLYFTQSQTRLKHFLLGRIEVKILEALCLYQMKQRAKAFESLECAYRLSLSNSLLMPFVEHGKSMRTLTTAIKRDGSCNIPVTWLGDVNRRSAIYAKHLNLVASAYRKANGMYNDPRLTTLETSILAALVDGLSRSEIATQTSLSINTVKTVLNTIYLKLGATNRAEAIRITIERKLL